MAYNQGDYIEVKDKLRLAYERWPEMRIQESAPRIVEVAGDVKIEITVTIWRDPDDPMPAVFSCHEVYPGQTPFTRGSEQQNCSTSAVGRALSMMGIGLGSPVASAEDVRKASEAPTGPSEPPKQQFRTTTPDGGGRRSEPTEKMVKFAKMLADKNGVTLSKAELDSFDACKAFIDRYKQ